MAMDDSREVALLQALQRKVDELSASVTANEAKASAVLDALKEELKALNAAIRGNGRPGVITEVVEMREGMRNIRRRLEQIESAAGITATEQRAILWKVILGIFGAVVAAGVGYFVRAAGGQ